MRDRSHTSLSQFNIQLEKTCKRGIHRWNRFPRDAVSDSTTLLDKEIWSITYPRDFRSLRSLTLIHWYFPEVLFWRVHLDLLEMSFNWLSYYQKVLLKVLLNNKEVCLKYFYWTDSLSGNELFGNILGSDVKDLFRKMRFRRKGYRLVPLVYRRGYRDKGARRPSHQWVPSSDFSLNELQIEIEKERNSINRLVNRLLEILEKI